jgi:hypothetical protein
LIEQWSETAGVSAVSKAEIELDLEAKNVSQRCGRLIEVTFQIDAEIPLRSSVLSSQIMYEKLQFTYI